MLALIPGFGCTTTRTDNTILIFVKPKGHVEAKPYQKAKSIRGIEVVFPPEEMHRERTVALVLSKSQVSLMNFLSEFSIEHISSSSDPLRVVLHYKPSEWGSEGEGFFQKNLLVKNSADRRECKAIYVSKQSVHISNYHCMKSEEDCAHSVITGAGSHERCKDILYSDAANEIVIFSTQSDDPHQKEPTESNPTLVMTPECVVEKDQRGASAGGCALDER